MSKLLRSELKSIVKECLVEILSEGLADKSRLTENSDHERLRKISTKKNKQTNVILG